MLNRIEHEKQTLTFMVHAYCRLAHKQQGGPCPSCAALISYAHQRLDHCRYGNEKSSCRTCPTHCYAPKQKAEISKVMRSAGPRMLYLMPLEIKKRELDKFLPLPTSIARKLNEQFIVEWTYNSNAIEGNTLSLQEKEHR
ncbi:nitrous oxide-stimulated promoter family protein [Treponema sp.]